MNQYDPTVTVTRPFIDHLSNVRPQDALRADMDTYSDPRRAAELRERARIPEGSVYSDRS